jgi:hypothetical protein
VSSVTYDPNRDLREAKAMADALIPYVYEEPLYGTTRGGMFGSGNMPALTVGALLLRLRRLRALEASLTPQQLQQLSEVEQKHESVRKEWRNHYIEKLRREGESRLKAMDTFFEECTDDPSQCANVYLPEVLRRTIVQEVARELTAQNEADDALGTSMRRVDSKLRRFTKPADFLWASGLQEVYSPDEFWWLYAAPPKTNREKNK